MENDTSYTARDRQEKGHEFRDEFERHLYSLIDLPGSVTTREVTKTLRKRRGVGTETFIVQTYRMPMDRGFGKGKKHIGDLIFLQHIDGEKTTRLVIPPEVAETIARQRTQVSDKLRSRIAKRTMQERKDRGEVFGFQKKEPA